MNSGYTAKSFEDASPSSFVSSYKSQEYDQEKFVGYAEVSKDSEFDETTRKIMLKEACKKWIEYQKTKNRMDNGITLSRKNIQDLIKRYKREANKLNKIDDKQVDELIDVIGRYKEDKDNFDMMCKEILETCQSEY